MTNNNMNSESVSTAAAAAVLHPQGDLVAARLPELRARLKEVANSGVLHLTLDLAGVQMVDSAGIGLLIAAHNSMKKVGGDIALIHAASHIVDLFRTMRIQQHFSVSGN
jgi:anti-anti-sigma factor